MEIQKRISALQVWKQKEISCKVGRLKHKFEGSIDHYHRMETKEEELSVTWLVPPNFHPS